MLKKRTAEENVAQPLLAGLGKMVHDFTRNTKKK